MFVGLLVDQVYSLEGQVKLTELPGVSVLHLEWTLLISPEKLTGRDAEISRCLSRDIRVTQVSELLLLLRRVSWCW